MGGRRVLDRRLNPGVAVGRTRRALRSLSRSPLNASIVGRLPMRALVVVVLLAAVGAVGGFVLALGVGAIVFGNSHTGVFDAFFLAEAVALVAAIGLPLYWYRRSIRRSHPWER